MPKLCDRCFKPITKSMQRYTVKIEVYASADEKLAITKKDLQKDFHKEIKDLINIMKNMSSEELMEDIYVKFMYNLCPKCHSLYVSALKEEVKDKMLFKKISYKHLNSQILSENKN
ncbi:MAG: hypothetical protein AABY84_05835 [Candidatus Firestonebacteria bacterium]